MPNNTSNYDHYRQADTETFLKMMFTDLVIKAHDKGEFTDSIRDYFISKSPEGWDELEECYNEFLKCIEKKQYYQLLTRIEKAEVVIDQEKDMRKRQFYVKKMKELAEQLESMGPA